MWGCETWGEKLSRLNFAQGQRRHIFHFQGKTLAGFKNCCTSVFIIEQLWSIINSNSQIESQGIF